ncbi:hypothetical protein LLG95_16615 [bacterium]|nr:hypothetical protein [bacterium]
MKRGLWLRSAWLFVMFILAVPVAVAAAKTPAPAPPPPARTQDSALRTQDSVSITGVIPPAGERFDGRVTVIFNQPIRQDGATTQPLQFRPPMKGQFQTGANYISFSTEMQPAAKVIEGRVDRAIAPAGTRFYFTTFDFKAASFWTIDSMTTATMYGLDFTSAVEPQAVKPQLTLTDGAGKAVPFDVMRGTAPTVMRLLVKGVPPATLNLKVRAGVPEAGRRFRTARDAEFSISQQATMFVARSASFGEINRERQDIRIYFNQAVKSETLRTRLKITDLSTSTTRELPFTIARAQDNWVDVRIASPNPYDVKLRLELAAGVEAGDGSKTALAWSQELAVITRLRLERTYWNTDSEKGLALELMFDFPLKLDEVKKHLSIQPELPGMQVEQSGEKQFTIRGDFAPETPYRLGLAPGVSYAGWAVLNRTLPIVVTSPKELPTWIGFPELGKYYFPRRFGNTVPARSRGYKELDVTLCKMFPNNVAVGVSDINRMTREWGYGSMERWSEDVGSAKIAVKGSLSKLITTRIALDQLTTAPLKGIYCLSIKGQANEYGYAETKKRVVLMTDLGALVHWQAGEATIFVHNLYSLAPVAAAKIKVYSNKNQLLGEGATDGQGIAELGPFDTAKGSPRVAVIVAGEDYTFVDLESREDDTDVFDQGSGTYNPKAYGAFIYADRDLYRPGETAHLRWVVRQNYGDALAGAPLVLKVRKPSGRTAIERTVTLSKLGTGEIDFATLDSYPTGNYTVTLNVPGNDTPIGSYRFNLEEFVPLRMKAELEAPAAPWVEKGKPFSLAVRARHLTGQPAAGRVAEASIAFSYGFGFKEWPQYRFGNDEMKSISTLELGQKATDDRGEAKFEFNAPEAAQATQPLRARVMGRVFELGGRGVRAAADAVYFPSPICIGVKADPGNGEDEVVVNVAAVDAEGRAANVEKAQVILERETYNYYVRRYYTHLEPQWSNRFEQVEKHDVALEKGVGKLSLHVTTYGFYRVRVVSGGTRQFSTIGFYAYGGKPRIERDAQPSLIKLKLEKGEVAIGETARLRIESAFDGKGIVAIHGEHIYKLVPVEIKGGSTTVELPIEKGYAPNVWLEATVIHAVEKGRAQVYPFSSFAAAALMVRDPARRIDVTMPSLPVEVLPGTRLPVAIRTRGGDGKPVSAEITLAAVDEGIHLITGYKTPDPAAWFARLRRPEFHRSHYYDKIAPDFDAPAAGGDGEMGAERMGRPSRTWIKTVALWSGVVTSGADGMASVTLDVPSYFNGQIRLVAVAADVHASGVGEKQLFVRRPFMLQTSLPRFMLPGDRAAALATVYNTTDATGTVRLMVATSGTLTLTESTSATFTVRPHSDATRTFEIKAGRSIGQGEVMWKAEVASGTRIETLREDMLLPVTEPAAWQNRRTLSVLAPGKTMAIDTAGFMQDDWTRLSVTVGADPLLRLEKALKDVVGYPYGCVEQVTSKLMSLYLLRKNTALVAGLDPKLGPIDVYISTGIDRLLAMQTASGGLAYWPGYGEAYPYGSVYGLHFLTLVKKGREIPVDQNNYDVLRRYVRELVTETRGDSMSDHYLRAYATYVLALAGDPQAPTLAEWFRLLELPRSGRWLLGAALAVSTHDTDRVRLYLEAARTMPYAGREQYGTLNSPVRNEAVELMSLVNMNGKKEEMLKRADDLTQWLQTERWGTTQENAFTIAALCQYLDKVSSGVTQAEATITTGTTATKIKGRELFRKETKGPGAKFTVTNNGPVDVYVTAVAAGIPTDTPKKAVSNGIGISRRILGHKGEVVDPTKLQQGASYVVELEIHCDREVRNMVVTDLLPAGLEIENPRLNQDERTGIILPHGPVQPMHIEMRDERLVLVFDQLPATPRRNHYFYYVVNAVTPGQFQQPPVDAEAMYDPAVRGQSAPGEIRVGRQ